MTVLRIVRGDPTDEEVAAVVVALHAVQVPTTPSPPPRRSAWASRPLRTALPHGPGAWRSLALPHG